MRFGNGLHVESHELDVFQDAADTPEDDEASRALLLWFRDRV